VPRVRRGVGFRVWGAKKKSSHGFGASEKFAPVKKHEHVHGLRDLRGPRTSESNFGWN
jgi:hypothetical protein